MINLILATIAIVFTAVMMGAGLVYFSPAVMADLRVSERVVNGFRRLSGGYAAYVVANQSRPTELNWQTQLMPHYTTLPELPDQTPNASWSYGTTNINTNDTRAYICLNVPNSPPVSDLVYRSLMRSGRYFSTDINRVLADAGVAVDVDECADLDVTAITNYVQSTFGAPAAEVDQAIQDHVLGRPQVEFRMGGCNGIGQGDGIGRNHPICWSRSPPQGPFALVFLLE